MKNCMRVYSALITYRICSLLTRDLWSLYYAADRILFFKNLTGRIRILKKCILYKKFSIFIILIYSLFKLRGPISYTFREIVSFVDIKSKIMYIIKIEKIHNAVLYTFNVIVGRDRQYTAEGPRVEDPYTV